MSVDFRSHDDSSHRMDGEGLLSRKGGGKTDLVFQVSSHLTGNLLQ